MSVPFFELTRQYARLKEELNLPVLKVLSSGMYIDGEVLDAFERNFAAYCNTKYAVGVGSGTDALIISMRALDIGAGDEVIIPSFTFFATGEAVANVGATPIFADVDMDTMCILPESIEKKLSAKTRAIIPVHLFGHPAPMDEINRIAAQNELYIIEDACQSAGASLDGHKTGSLGTTGAFSFFPTKNLGAAGDGGIITTNNQDIALKSRKFGSHGATKKYQNEMLGYNSRLDSIQAKILDIKLAHLDQFNEQRRENARLYNKFLADVEQIKLPVESTCAYHIYHQYTIRVLDGQRDELVQFLKEQDIGVAIYYPVPVHRLGPFVGCADEKDLPNTNQLAEEVVSLPIFCLLYTSPSPRDLSTSRMPSSA